MSKKKRGTFSFWQTVLIIVGVILLVLVVADAFAKYRDKNKTDDERLQDLKKLREKHNQGIKKSLKNEYWIYLTARSIISLLLLGTNALFYFFYCIESSWEKALGSMLNLNEALILSYSFIAFTLYGTPSKFVKGIRQVIYRWRKRRNIPENVNINDLNNEISALETKIEAEKENKPEK